MNPNAGVTTPVFSRDRIRRIFLHREQERRRWDSKLGIFACHGICRCMVNWAAA